MRLAALVLAALPCAALAQAPASTPAPATPAAVPNWSIGAGVLFGGDTPTLIGVTPSGSALVVPTVRASLERRVGPRSWLALALSGSVQSAKVDAGAAGNGESTLRGGYAAVGARTLVTPAGAPVEVSVYALGELGRSSYEQDVSGVTPNPERHVSLAGLSVGFGVERRLAESLSVRIFSRVARAAWSWGEIKSPGDPTEDLSAFEAGFALVPGVELRMQF